MRLVLLLALGLLVGCRLAPGPDDGPRLPTRIDPFDPDYLQLGTFNADWLTADLPGDFTLRNEVDLSMMASLITAMDIDLLALQEVDGDEAMEAFQMCAKLEGIIPALESSHALAYLSHLAPTMSRDKIIVACLSGRGDKDVHTVAARLGVEI